MGIVGGPVNKRRSRACVSPLVWVVLLLTLSSTGPARDRPRQTQADSSSVAPSLNMSHRRAQSSIKPILLSSGTLRIQARVAATSRLREIGLSKRRVMPIHQGMLFVWPTPGLYCMWMKGTTVPLTALFLSDQGQVLSIQPMTPHTLDRHCSPKPVRFILEVAQSWRGQGIIREGTVLEGLDQAPMGH